MERYVCIHGHFYQPPRENPWLEAVELQDSAYPYHDWNARIAEECYAPNAASRILDGEGRILSIVNNYARISFNVGPTLLAWLDVEAPEVYRAIVDADLVSRERFSGHGSALAQPYNHLIMPLANRRDKRTQVRWGIVDFEHRFGRQPEGMWLPETAVDLETLDILAEQRIRFTILAPSQARRVRRAGRRAWRDMSGGRVDPTMTYQARLPSGRTICLFFYDGPISRAVAFEGVLANGEQFAHRLLDGFDDARTWPQICHIATDGETYGHHHRYGDMALAYASHYLEANRLAHITNYGEYLERHLPTHEVEIFEHTSWSCAHGVDRWRSDCGCHSGGHPGWNQGWRAPLRQAMDWLREMLAPRYEEHARRFLRDPWAARDDYIRVLLDRSPDNLDRFLAEHATRPLEAQERATVWKLLELQRHSMLMYTSCGWFFDEISGIETVQVIQYAGRAVQLAEDLFGDSLESGFVERLSETKSNIPEHRDGALVYEKFVKPAMVDLAKVGAHYAISGLFEPYGDRSRIYCYTVDRQDHQTLAVGKARLAVGRAQVTSEITQESAVLSYGVLHFGEHNLHGAVRAYRGEEAYAEMVRDVTEAFTRADFADVIRLFDRYFEGVTYSLRLLFRDEQRKVLNQILEATLAEVEASYRQIYAHHAPLMRFLRDLGIPQPRALHAAAEFTLTTDLRRAFAADVPDFERIAALLDEARTWDIPLDGAGLRYALEQTLRRMGERLQATPTDLRLLEQLDRAAALARAMPSPVQLWKTQNTYYALRQSLYPEVRERAEQGDEDARAWVDQFAALGRTLGMRAAG
ncbi:MAG: DUF3536 domain-containing protein [Armatimonadetes bacterium]|nr:DUF3536 domain-containing protein [Armatimonadota bacterium]